MFDEKRQGVSAFGNRTENLADLSQTDHSGIKLKRLEGDLGINIMTSHESANTADKLSSNA